MKAVFDWVYLSNFVTGCSLGIIIILLNQQNIIQWQIKHISRMVTSWIVSSMIKVTGDMILISMHLCKGYTGSATTNMDNMQNINAEVP